VAAWRDDHIIARLLQSSFDALRKGKEITRPAMRGSEICLREIVQNGLASIGAEQGRRGARMRPYPGRPMSYKGENAGNAGHKSHGHSQPRDAKKKKESKMESFEKERTKTKKQCLIGSLQRRCSCGDCVDKRATGARHLSQFLIKSGLIKCQ
jgi:hypothetical protein